MSGNPKGHGLYMYIEREREIDTHTHIFTNLGPGRAHETVPIQNPMCIPKMALLSVILTVAHLMLQQTLGPKRHINIGIQQRMILESPLYWALEPACRICVVF